MISDDTAEHDERQIETSGSLTSELPRLLSDATIVARDRVPCISIRDKDLLEISGCWQSRRNIEKTLLELHCRFGLQTVLLVKLLQVRLLVRIKWLARASTSGCLNLKTTAELLVRSSVVDDPGS